METRTMKVNPPICETVVVKEVFLRTLNVSLALLATNKDIRPQDGDLHSCSAQVAAASATLTTETQSGEYAIRPGHGKLAPGDRVRLCLVSGHGWVSARR